MHELTKDRVKLIRMLIKAVQSAQCKNYDGFPMRVCDAYPAECGELIRRIRKDEDKHYLSYSQDDPAKVSYAPEPGFKYIRGRRIRLTFGRYVRRRLGILQAILPDLALSSISAYLFGSLSDAGKSIEIVNGMGIVDAYYNDFGGCSCMTGNENIVNLYSLTPDKISLIKYRNSINARALLWTTDKGDRVLDRIYPNSGSHIDALHSWCIREGIVYRVGQSLPDEDNIQLSDGKNHTITVNHKGTFPYMDTFHYGEVSDAGKTAILSNAVEDFPHRFDNTCGSYHSSREYTICVSCEERIHFDEAEIYYGGDDPYCLGCYRDSYCECDMCGCMSYIDDMIQVDFLTHREHRELCICGECDHLTYGCSSCGETFIFTQTGEGRYEHNEEEYCWECHEELKQEEEEEAEKTS